MWIDEAGVLWHRLDTGITVRAEHAPEVASAVDQLSGGNRVRAVVDISGVQFADRQARDAFSNTIDHSVEVATAIIVNSSISRMLGTLFLKLSRPTRPVRMFLDNDEAAAWVAGVVAER
jgi:hypothetical protein